MEGNGDRFNRQVKATQAYGEMTAAMAEQNRLLFGDKERGSKGYLPEIKDSLDALTQNPIVRLGFLLDSTVKLSVAFLTLIASFASLILAVHVIGQWLKWWQ